MEQQKYQSLIWSLLNYGTKGIHHIFFITQILFLVIINSFEDSVSHWMINFFFFFINFQEAFPFETRLRFLFFLIYFNCNLSFFYQTVNKALKMKNYVNTLRVCLNRTYLLKLKTKNRKYYNKIIFKCVNSTIKSIFNEKIVKK